MEFDNLIAFDELTPIEAKDVLKKLLCGESMCAGPYACGTMFLSFEKGAWNLKKQSPSVISFDRIDRSQAVYFIKLFVKDHNEGVARRLNEIKWVEQQIEGP